MDLRTRIREFQERAALITDQHHAPTIVKHALPLLLEMELEVERLATHLENCGKHLQESGATIATCAERLELADKVIERLRSTLDSISKDPTSSLVEFAAESAVNAVSTPGPLYWPMEK